MNLTKIKRRKLLFLFYNLSIIWYYNPLKRRVFMEKNKDDWTSNYDSSDYEIESKYFNTFIKVAMGSSIAILITTILSTFNMATLPIFLLIIAIIVPSVFITATKLKKHADRVFHRDMYESKMLGLYMQEAFSKEHKIDKNTTYFMHELRDAKIDIGIENNLNINQLIYLINQSYYEKINKNANMSRHELVIKILEQVKIYIENIHPDDKYIFDYKDAGSIINGCIFIPDEVKKEVLDAFLKARVATSSRTSFVIETLDSPVNNRSLEEYLNSREYTLSRFDVDDIKGYEALKEIYQSNECNPYKDAFLVNWDLESIRDCMSLIVRRFGIIIEEYTDELYHYEMVANFFFNLNAYASINKVSSVGMREIINTFKGWDYFDFNLKLDIIDAIFEEFNLDYSMHPYRDKKKNKNVGKVYHFPKQDKNPK